MEKGLMEDKEWDEVTFSQNRRHNLSKNVSEFEKLKSPKNKIKKLTLIKVFF